MRLVACRGIGALIAAATLVLSFPALADPLSMADPYPTKTVAASANKSYHW